MPLWARFLCAATCCAAAVLLGLVAGAWWRLGYPEFWADLWRYAATARFWELTGRLWLLGAAAQVLAQVLRAAAGWRAGTAGLVGGALVALALAAYLTGRFDLAPRAVAPDAAAMAAGFALAGAVGAWVHDRL